MKHKCKQETPYPPKIMSQRTANREIANLVLLKT